MPERKGPTIHNGKAVSIGSYEKSLDPLVKHIPLTEGQYAKVDAEDFDALVGFRWYATQERVGSYTRYAFRGGWVRNPDNPLRMKKGTTRMHRQVLGYDGPLQVDHINGDGLDNRKSNLRLATPLQNASNRLLNPDNTPFGFVGVSQAKDGKFQSTMMFDGTRYHCGYHATPEAASIAREAKARELHGEFYCDAYDAAA
jgi:HNH endonuclease